LSTLANLSSTQSAIQSDIVVVDGNVDTLVSEIGSGRITGIKTKTDTIAWTDVDAILTDTADMQPKVTTLISEIGSGNITGIKTATDTIAWTDVTAILTDTADIQPRISNVQTNLNDLITDLIVSRNAVNDNAATTTGFITDLTSSVDDFYNGQLIVFTTGDLAGQVRAIIDYNGATKAISVDALSSAPDSTDSFTVLSTGPIMSSVNVASIWNYATRTLTDAVLDSGSLSTLAELTSEFTEIKGTAWTESDTLATVHDFVDDIDGRFTDARAGYLDKINNATYGVEAIKDLVDAVDSSTELNARFDEVKGAGWSTADTLQSVKSYATDLDTHLTDTRIGYLDNLNISESMQTGVLDKLDDINSAVQASRSSGDTITLEGDLSIIRNAVDSVMADMDALEQMSAKMQDLKLTGATMESLYGGLSQISKNIEEIHKVQGVDIDAGKFGSGISKGQISDIGSIKDKTAEIRAMVELSQEILAQRSDAPVTQSWMEFEKAEGEEE
ncbi:MAG: hypothetical protein RAP41_03635, partial [Candidatus Orphnella occulta]|nr:hypothetical protein [Candidatus Orphnella occulta]